MLATKYIAEKFVAPSLDAEQMGYIFASWFETIRAEDIDPLLEKHGLKLSTFDPNQWYPMQTALNVMKDIYDSGENVTEKFVALGIRAAQTFPIPPELRTVQEVMQVLLSPDMTNRFYRNIPKDFGMSLRTIDEKHVQAFYNQPYAVDTMYGVFWSTVSRFKPEQDVFAVRIIDNPDPDNYLGICFDIKWGTNPEDVE